MAVSTNWLSAGLVFLGQRDIDIVAMSNRISNTFDTLNQKVTGIRILSDGCAQISSRHHEVKIEVKEDRAIDGLDRRVPVYLSLEVARRTIEPPIGTPQIDALLAHVLKALQQSLSADLVQWADPNALISSVDFVMATSQIVDVPMKPRRPVAKRNSNSARPALPGVEETNEILQSRFTQKDVLVVEAAEQGRLRAAFLTDPDDIGVAAPPVEDISEKTAPLRLTVWMISFMISLFALPVGVALMVINLMKGENLRLASQTAALTGMFISFQVYGTTAQAMTVIQNFAG